MSAEEASSAFETASSGQRVEVFATAASQGGVGNDRVLPRSAGVGGQGGDDDFDDDEFNAVPLGGESFVIPDTHGPGDSWAEL